MRTFFLFGATVALGGCRGRPPVVLADAGRDAMADVAPDGGRAPPRIDVPMFHQTRDRQGWNAQEATLTPAHVASPSFGHRWDSEPLDTVVINGAPCPPHLYASPLYIDGLTLSGGPYAGANVPALIAASTNSFVYAISTVDTVANGMHISAGVILWRRQLTTATVSRGIPGASGFDGGVPLGVLSTPIVDLSASPPTLYVTALDASLVWRAFALDARDGTVLPGWPVDFDAAAVEPVNTNPPARLGPADQMTQRMALALSPDGRMLYAGFSSAAWTTTGWAVAIQTASHRVVSSFSTAPAGATIGRGGMWGSGGFAVDTDGSVYMTTGNGLQHVGPVPGWWGDSLLRWNPTLHLIGTYSPYNYCTLDDNDIDLSSSSPILFDLDPASTTASRLLSFGGKQGFAYLLDREHLPGALDHRPPCDRAPADDGSLLAPDVQQDFGTRGPLRAFDPYSPNVAAVDFARMHTTPALFRDSTGHTLVFLSGASKAGTGTTVADAESVAPGLARLRIATAPGQAPYLVRDAVNPTVRLWNPGSPVISSNGDHDAVVWVMDSNQRRSASLADPHAARTRLYAFDAQSLAVLFQSDDAVMGIGGKYSSPVVVHGMVFVGTDRIQAFGLQ